jgi:hypothetical protein
MSEPREWSFGTGLEVIGKPVISVPVPEAIAISKDRQLALAVLRSAGTSCDVTDYRPTDY